MKKKNIIKKLLSVVLSAATVFSLLTLPAHAIVAGEESYITSTIVSQYFCATEQTVQFTVSNDDDMYPGTSTHDFLNDAQSLQNFFNSDIETYAIIGDDDRITISTDPTWEMTVLILVGMDINNDFLTDKYLVGSGFLVDENVMVTAMHSLYPYKAVEGVLDSYNTVSITVYHGISSSQVRDVDEIAYLIAGAEMAHLESVTYDPRYFTSLETSGHNAAYDWCVVTLDNNFDSYYLDCDIAISSLEGSLIGVAGYPDEVSPQYRFLRKIGLGEVVAYDGVILVHDADTSKGQSGGPFMTNVLTTELVGYGIHISGTSKKDESGKEIGIENYARAITPEIYNTIVTIMEAS